MAGTPVATGPPRTAHPSVPDLHDPENNNLHTIPELDELPEQLPMGVVPVVSVPMMVPAIPVPPGLPPPPGLIAGPSPFMTPQFATRPGPVIEPFMTPQLTTRPDGGINIHLPAPSVTHREPSTREMATTTTIETQTTPLKQHQPWWAINMQTQTTPISESDSNSDQESVSLHSSCFLSWYILNS